MGTKEVNAIMREQAKKGEVAKIKKFCSAWELRFLNNKTQVPTKALFYYQLYSELGIRQDLVRKWKEVGDTRYDAIETTLELFIRAQVENAMVNPPSLIAANGIAKYYGAVYFANDRKAELQISGNKDQIVINVNGKDPFGEND